MLLPTLIGAIGLLSTAVEAAPKGTEFNKIRSETAVPRGAGKARGSHAFRARVAARADSDAYSPPNGYFPNPNLYNLTNTSMSTSSHHNTETIILFDDSSVATIGCPTASLFVSTTTVDITVFITATSNLTYTEEPCDDDSVTIHNTKDSALLSSASTDCDDETAPVYTGPKTATVVEEHYSTETEPCPDDALYPLNSTRLNSHSTHTAHIGPYNTGTEEPCTDDPLFPANETGRPPHYTDLSHWSTTLSTQASPTSDCDDETSTGGDPSIYTHDSIGNYSIPHATPVASTKLRDDQTSSPSPSSGPAVVYTLPFGDSNTTYTKPVEYALPRDDDTSSATPTSADTGRFTPDSFSNYNPPYVTPVASTEPRDDETSSATPTSHPSPLYTLPFGESNTTYTKPVEYALPRNNSTSAATPTSADPGIFTPVSAGNFTAPYKTPVASTEPRDDETSSATSASDPPVIQFTPLPSAHYNTSTPYTTPHESTEPCDDATSSTVASNVTATTPCDDDMTTTPISTPSAVPILPFGNSTTLSSTEPCDDETMTTSALSSSSTEPCDDETTTTAWTSTPLPGNATASSPESSSTESCDDETSTSGTLSVTPFLSPTTSTSASSTPEIYVIDNSMTPVSTAGLNTTGTYSLPAKEIICEHTVESGSPSKDNTYCGVHGKPASTYFIAEHIEDSPGVSVTLEGCYQFCKSDTGATRNCQSYRYYTSDNGASRCALYGRSISWSVRELDSSQPDLWYDLTCGSPSEEAWHSDMPTSHQGDDEESSLLDISISIKP
ncbi:hypothetical protein G7Z17_g12787 [Cylindrodendrum hubeiense]|uniref:Apple domain-containing protein n=1 Tax=Cylindrodendrum hubeiense TaxID=595255 RepID=A0A9P5L566_9HYPO|nr:hypothetical protein G7Z17_g12787 [Cylindrodendrum hubeiense]